MLPDISNLSRKELAALVIEAGARLALDDPAAAPAPQADESDTWLTADEAAELLRCSTKTLYRKARHMSCCRRNGRTLLFSRQGITKWLAKQRA